MSVKSGGSRYSRATSGSHRSNSRSPKPGSNDSADSPKVAIVETYGEDNSYKYAFTYEKATLYEFKYEKAPYPADIDPCYRCNRRVPKTDQVNVGVLFHKQCFRCRICGIPLTIQNFQRNDANTGDKEIYCRTHVGKKVAQIRSGEVAPMGIEGPSVGPGKKYVLQVTGTSSRPVARNPNQRQLPAPNQPPLGQREWGNNSPSPNNLNDTSQWSADQTQSSLDMSRDHRDRSGHHLGGFNHYVPEQMRKPIPHPTSVLRSFEDFDNAGVFEAQPLLEQRHREEEERLLRFLLEEREKELSRLDDMVDREKDKAAEELLASIENLSVHSVPRNLVDERDRIEEHFKQVKEERLKQVTEKIGAEEKTRSSKMIERWVQGQSLTLT